MTSDATSSATRRDFLSSVAAAAGGMSLGFYLPASVAKAAPVEAQPWYRDPTVPEINAWLTIAADETVTIRVAQTEMGTGVMTSCPMMVAEELQCDWNKVRAEYCSPQRDVVQKAPEWTLHMPGGGDPTVRDGGGRSAYDSTFPGVYRRLDTNSSGSVRESRYYLQMAGAEARERLLLAAAELWKVPTGELSAKDSVVTHTPSGRKTTYGKLAARAARLQLPDPSKIRIKGPDQFTLMGTEQRNRDVPLKVTGKAVYGIDVDLPGMLYAAVRACPVFGGKLKSFDFDAIRNRPGVHSAVRIEGKGPRENANFGTSGREYRYEAVAVVADSWWRAKKALDLMPIEWDYGPNAWRNTEELSAAYLRTLDEPGTIVLEDGGPYAEAKKKAAKVVSATYEVPYLAHARMEPGNATAMATKDRVDVWTGDQSPQFGLLRAAEEAGVTPDKVFIHTCFLGGGYGGGGGSDQIRQAVAIAKTLNGRPVKVLWTREEDMRLGEKYRPQGAARFEATLDAEGWPTAISYHTTSDPYDRRLVPTGTHKNGVYEQAVVCLDKLPYHVPTRYYEVHKLNTHIPVGFRRSVGWGVNTYYRESFIGELALAAGKDPYQFRRELIARNPDYPNRADWLKALDAVARLSGWGRKLPEGWAQGIAIEDRQRPTPTSISLGAEVVTISLSKSGVIRVERVDIAFDVGYGLVNPLSVRKQFEGQVAWALSDALWQEITIQDGRTVEGNFHEYRIARMEDYPPEINIEFLKSDNKWIAGVGEETIPHFAPALAQAIHRVTGKPVRKMPFGKYDLRWA